MRQATSHECGGSLPAREARASQAVDRKGRTWRTSTRAGVSALVRSRVAPDARIEYMHAMVLEGIGDPLVMKELANPPVLADEVFVRIEACGVCRTDLHVVDGDLPFVKPPVVPGHEIVGIVERVGRDVEELVAGARVGVPWLGGTCGMCAYCRD